MQLFTRRSLSLAVAAAALALAAIPQVNAKPVEVAQGSADDLGVMSINLKDVVKPQVGVQGQTQAAGTPNQAGLGGFLPLVVGKSSVFFADVLANANFADFNNYSSIINTTVAGTTISTSSRLGYRWLNGDRSWMYGINAGYDTRPMATGYADTGVSVNNRSTVFFQQAALNAEVVSDLWDFNAFALLPVGKKDSQLNNIYIGDDLNTYGMDVGYFIAPSWKVSVGYYFQDGDQGAVDGSGVQGRLAYEITSGVIAGVNPSYDEAFETRISADVQVRFGGKRITSKHNEDQEFPVINALFFAPKNRNIRVHDGSGGVCDREGECRSAPLIFRQ